MRVNWRDMGPEELGSVYESLLELTPRVTKEGREFTFAEGAEGKGHARKTTGSYYTPDSLVQVLLDSALNPVMDRAEASRPNARAEALLELTIIDPACGSGHFLLAAARRLAARVAQHEAKGTASPKEYRHALRRVVGRCIFGVDLNPLAVELCKVGLWMEAVEPGLPLGFLDSHVQCGNALLGTMPGLMDKGIPDEAWAPIGEDDKKTASALKKRNKLEAKQEGFDLQLSMQEAKALEQAARALDQASDENVAALANKEAEFTALRESSAFAHQLLVADAWCAAFVWPKPSLPDPLAENAPTNAVWRRLRAHENAAVVRRRIAASNQGLESGKHGEELTIAQVDRLARQYQFFHWQLVFPQVFARGGFDVVLGNPPWERVKLQEQEFFASRNEAIASAENAAKRKMLIARLPEEDPRLWRGWCEASRSADGQSQFVRNSGRYPLCGKGDVNTYALFAEFNAQVISPRGRTGFLAPSGLVADDTTKDFFQSIVAAKRLCSVHHFENEEKVFPGVHHAFRFVLVTLGRQGAAQSADLVFFARQVSALADPSKHFTLNPADFETLNPNTKTCPTFRSRRDSDLNLAMYRRAGVLWREDDETNGNPWGLRFMAMLHMANDSGLFRSREQLKADGFELHGSVFLRGKVTCLPLVEGRMVDMFDHRLASVETEDVRTKMRSASSAFLSDAEKVNPKAVVLPRSWVESKVVEDRLHDRWPRGWMLGWRDITQSTVQRTLIASVVPRTATGDTLLLAFSASAPPLIAALYANMTSYVLDYAARQKVGGMHLKYHVMKQLPVLPPSAYAHERWGTAWLLPRVVELTYTAWDLEAFGTDVGFEGPPFRWDAERRTLLRAELDAAFFHLYRLSRDDTDYVLETFPIVRKNDEKKYGEYRTKRLILERYDALSAASHSGNYKTPLNPPPAHDSMRHAPRK